VHTAGVSAPAILWCVTNEPALAFEHLTPPATGDAAVDPVHSHVRLFKLQM